MTDEYIIEAVIACLREAESRLKRGQKYTAYDSVRRARGALYAVESSLAHQSVKAAMDWGCAVRLPDGTVGIME